MPQPNHISKLGVPDPATLDNDLQAIWQKCVDKLGFVPNVFSAYSLKPQRLRNFMSMYNEIMLSDSGLSKLEREMVAVVVSSANRCYYCLVAHGAAVRALSGDPELGEMMALNYRVAKLDPRQRAMLDYAWKLTTTPWLVDDADRAGLRKPSWLSLAMWSWLLSIRPRPESRYARCRSSYERRSRRRNAAATSSATPRP